MKTKLFISCTFSFARSSSNLPPFVDADSVEEKLIPMLEWLQTELRAPPREVTLFACRNAQYVADQDGDVLSTN